MNTNKYFKAAVILGVLNTFAGLGVYFFCEDKTFKEYAYFALVGVIFFVVVLMGMAAVYGLRNTGMAKED